MKNNAPSGLMALDIINPNYKIGDWLHEMSVRGIVAPGILREAELHFGLRRAAEDWRIFLKRVFSLMGVLLAVIGLIFFMAWNWENLSRFAKFATVEIVFVLFAAWSVLRWNKGGGEAPWDARVALLGAGLTVGGMLALYGQIYQTGADPWELFRAWTIILLALAIPGRATAFWFMVWLVGSTWLGLYLSTITNDFFDIFDNITLIFIAFQFAMLALSEAARHLLARRGIAWDEGRWLSRIIGSTAIVIMFFYAAALALLSNYNTDYGAYSAIAYILSIGIVLYVYYRIIPELLFLSLSILSFAAFICINMSIELIKSNSSAGSFLLLGLFILGMTFGTLKLIMILHKSLRARSKSDAGAKTGVAHTLGFLKKREEKKVELKDWLVTRGVAKIEDIDAFYAAEELEQERETPWYAKIFITLGVWTGSGLSLGAATILLFEGLRDPSGLGIVGLVFCGISIAMGQGKTLPMQAFSQIIGICGLLYASLLFDFRQSPTSALLALLFGLFWLLKPPFAARLGAFMGAIICFFLYLEKSRAYSYGDVVNLGWYIKTILYVAGLLWAAHFLVLMEGKAPARLGPGGGRFDPGEVLKASAYGSLFVFAGIAICLSSEADFRFMGFGLNLGTCVVFAALGGLLAWRYPALRLAALPLGLLLCATAWFAPALALGLGLVFLAFYTGKNSFLGAAVAYLGFSTFFYYYNLELSLLHKSFVLMGTGAFLLALAFAAPRLIKGARS